MPQLIDIPEVGQVEFPDGMAEDQILKAIETDIVPSARRDAFAAAPSGRAVGPSEPDPVTARSTIPGTFGGGSVAAPTMLGVESARIAPPVLNPAQQAKADADVEAAMSEPIGGPLTPAFKKNLADTLAAGVLTAASYGSLGVKLDPEFVRGMTEEAVNLEETMRTVPGVLTASAISAPGAPGTVAKAILSGVMAKEFGKTLGELDVASAEGKKRESGVLAMRGLFTGAGAFGLVPGMAKTVVEGKAPPVLTAPEVATKLAEAVEPKSKPSETMLPAAAEAVGEMEKPTEPTVAAKPPVMAPEVQAELPKTEMAKKPASELSGIEPGVGANPIPQIARAIESTTRDIKDWLRTHVKDRIGPDDLPEMKFRRGQMLPDFQSPEISEQIANAPHGLGNIPGLGMLFDPRAKSVRPAERAIIQRQFEKTIGDNIAILMGQQLKGKIDDAFTVQPGTSRIVDVTPARPGLSTHISDFFENLQRDPDSYILTPKQREAADLALAVEKQLQDLADRNGVGRRTENEVASDAPDRIEPEDAATEAAPYFTRIRIDVPKGRSSSSIGGSKPGTKPYFDKSRYYETEEAGASAETPVHYEPSIEKRLTTRAQKLYQKIADKRMAENPALQGVTGRPPLFGEGQINLPAFRSRVYPLEVADTVNRFFSSEHSKVISNLVNANSVLKGMDFGLDWGAPFLQGLPMFLDPTKTHLWAKAAGYSLKAFLTDKVMTRYLENNDNLIAARELAQMGVNLGQLTDYMAGLQQGHFLSKFPGFKQAAQSFGVFLETGILELWKAYRDVTPKDQWPKVAETLQNVMQHGRTREAGMSHGQALAEQAAFLAPAYFRGAINLLADVTEGGKSGSIARRSLTGMALGGTMLFAFLAKQAGLDWDQIEARLNPSKPNFMAVPVKFADGRVREFSFGGGIKSLVTFTAKLADAVINQDASRLGTGIDKNVVGRFLRGKLAPLPGAGLDIALGSDFLGNDVTWTDVLKARTMPLMVQSMIQRPGEPPATAGDILPGAAGLTVYPETIRNQFSQEREAKARELFSKPYEKLDLKQQLTVTQSVQKEPIFQVKDPVSKRVMKLAIDADVERINRIKMALPTEIVTDMDKLQVRPLGYDATLHLAPHVTLPLTADQLKTYESLIVSNYSKVLPKLLENEKFRSLEPDRRSELANKLMKQAKEAARAQLMQSVQQKAKQ